MMQRVFLVCTVWALASMANAGNPDDTMTSEQIVHRFVEVFNAHDVDRMLEMVTDDVQWLSVDGDDIAVEASGKAQLRSGMTDYFASCTSCKSRLVHVFSTADRVSALEEASYETDSGLQTQRSLSVYEFSGSLIKRVYYFPTEK
ncbi:MAG: nuclear transport factor 2 family protein [Pseudomonadota bacterium]